MSRCPYCDIDLEPAVVGDYSAQACRECGGLLFSGAELAALTKEAPSLLSTFDRGYNQGLAGAACAGTDPTCPQCHKPLVGRAFPIARQLPLLACGDCRLVWLRDGEGEQLQEAVAPGSVTPAWSEQAEAALADRDARADDAAEVQDLSLKELGYGPWGLWPARDYSQPWLSWFVCGMPLWFALPVLFVAGLLWAGVYAFSPTLREYSALGLIMPFLFWPIQSLFLCLALHLAWLFTYDNPGLAFNQTMGLMLRVVPFLLVVDVLGGVLTSVTGSALLSWLTQVALTVLIYVKVMELDARDIVLLTIAKSVLSSLFGLGGVLLLAA